MIIVGRDITHASDPKQQAVLYRNKAWGIYKKMQL
jgi:3-keto-L-gulonate-6-phosphate decarboxylase